jgi:4-amino-4-deoxy-L-arabinose transferase-like glycosyltransferase
MTVIDLAALATGGVIVAATAVLGASALRVRGTAAFLLAALVIGAATIVLATTALSLVDLYRRGPMLIGQFLVLVAVGITWAATGRPLPSREGIPSRRDAWHAACRHPAIAILAAAALFALVIEALLALFVVPNNWDSMWYHLTRVGYWLQYDSVLHFPGGSTQQLQFPPNAEILQGWTMLLSNGDRFAQFVQLTAMVGTTLAVYLGARVIRFSRPASLFAALLFATLPEVVLESTTTQNDIVVASFLTTGAVFTARAISKNSWGDMIVAAMAVGLALGTKGTAFMAGPGLVLITVAAVLRWRPPRPVVLGGAALAAAGFLLLGSTNYIQNALNFGSPLGDTTNIVERHRSLPANAALIGWSFVDFPGFGPPEVTPPATDAGSWIVTAIQNGAQELLGPNAEHIAGPADGFPVQVPTAVHEDYTGFGPIGFAVLLPLLAAYAFGWRSPPDRRVVALAAISYLVTMALLLDANEWIMRLTITAVALGAPLFARIEPIGWLRSITVLIAVFVLIPSLFLNVHKPLGFDDPLAFLKADRISQQAVGEASRPSGQGLEMEAALRRIETAIPPNGRIAVIGIEVGWEYPFFGPYFERYLHRIHAPDAPPIRPESLMQDENLDAVIWMGEAAMPPRKAQFLGSGYYLLARSDEPSR